MFRYNATRFSFSSSSTKRKSFFNGSQQTKTDIPSEESIKSSFATTQEEKMSKPTTGKDAIAKKREKKIAKGKKRFNELCLCVAALCLLFSSFYSLRRLALNVKHRLTSGQPSFFLSLFILRCGSRPNRIRSAFYQHPEMVLSLNCQYKSEA